MSGESDWDKADEAAQESLSGDRWRATHNVGRTVSLKMGAVKTVETQRGEWTFRECEVTVLGADGKGYEIFTDVPISGVWLTPAIAGFDNGHRTSPGVIVSEAGGSGATIKVRACTDAELKAWEAIVPSY
jgi:hypothetical protein